MNSRKCVNSERGLTTDANGERTGMVKWTGPIHRASCRGGCGQKERTSKIKDIARRRDSAARTVH